MAAASDPPHGACAGRAADVVRRALAATGLDVEESPGQRFTVTLPGSRKLATTCSLHVGEHSLTVNAFVARRPAERHAEVYRYLLERNVRATGVAFALDTRGDVYLVGRLPVAAVDEESVDELLGAVLTAADETFDGILERGFASAIRAEWEWRRRTGQPTANLEAFRHLLPDGGRDG